MEIRLKEKYKKEIVPVLTKDLGRSNILSLPRVVKVVVNFGIGRFKDDKGLIESTKKDITVICGQKPQVRHAKKAISNFKLRKGDIIGMSVTLRGDRMWAFLDKLFNIVLPRVRDFKGLSKKAFDGSGNYTIGLTEHTVFPEVNPNAVDKIKSLEVTIVTNAKNNNEGELLLLGLGLPLQRKE